MVSTGWPGLSLIPVCSFGEAGGAACGGGLTASVGTTTAGMRASAATSWLQKLRSRTGRAAGRKASVSRASEMRTCSMKDLGDTGFPFDCGSMLPGRSI